MSRSAPSAVLSIAVGLGEPVAAWTSEARAPAALSRRLRLREPALGGIEAACRFVTLATVGVERAAGAAAIRERLQAPASSMRSIQRSTARRARRCGP